MVTTEHARHFYNPEAVAVTVYSDKDEWEVVKHLPGLIMISGHIIDMIKHSNEVSVPF